MSWYRWDQSKRVWHRRKKYDFVIGRTWDFSPSAGDVFYLRRLLCYTVGAETFHELLNGHKTYKEAAYAKGLFIENKGTCIQF